jgi:hypothetical protein
MCLSWRGQPVVARSRKNSWWLTWQRLPVEAGGCCRETQTCPVWEPLRNLEV